jgi:glycosyltransferase involved in cell wall biosynthesis
MTASGPKVLFLAPVEPWCRENGSSVIIADQLEGLAAHGGAELLPVFLRRPPPGYVPHAPAGLEGIRLSLEGVPRWVSIAKAILLATSPLRVRFDNAAATKVVLGEVRARGFVPTVVHVEHLPLVDIALRIARHYGVPVVYRSHNIEAVLLGRRASLPGPANKVLLKLAARAEADAMRRCDATLCISDVDLTWARAHAPGARTELMPCSLLMSRYRADLDAAPAAQLGFVGGLDWAPNEAGLRWFVAAVLPLILRDRPDAKLAVLARGASERAWLTQNSAVRILPPEQDALALFASSRASLAPLLHGGGVRIKIPESLAVGAPVVATTIGAEGHDLPGISRADDPADFARACVQRLTAPLAAADRRALRAAVEARHGATVLAERLVALWSQLARDHRGH